VAQINRRVEGYVPGERLEVVSVHDDYVLARSGGTIKELPIWEPESFGVYKIESIEIAEGDRIRITANGKTADGHRVYNGGMFTVDHIADDGKILLNNGWRLAENFGHLDWGYAMTSISSQGKDVDWVFLAQSPELSYGASDANQIYVSISRGSEGFKLYSTCLQTVRELVSRERERPMATEVFQAQAAESAEKPICEERSKAAERSDSERVGKKVGRELPTSERLGQEKKMEKEKLEKALEMAYPVPEQEAADYVRGMEAAECDMVMEM
jgi:ATP-dependent exoDNAse (exonuclease V) alpha subunit